MDFDSVASSCAQTCPEYAEVNQQEDTQQDTQDIHEQESDDEESADLINSLDKLKGSQCQEMVSISGGSGSGVLSELPTVSAMESILTNSIMKLSENTSSNINALNSLVISMGLKVQSDILEISDRIDSAGKLVDERMEKMQAEINRLTSKKIENSMFSSDIGRILWSVLPLFFDGSRGIYSWFPVTFTDTSNNIQDVVVISVPMTVYLLSLFDGRSGPRIKTETENHLRSLDRFQLAGDERLDNFKRIITKTPFKPYAMYSGGAKKKPITFRNNSENYIVVRASYWRGLINSASEFFEERPMAIPHSSKAIPKNGMSQRWALQSVSRNDFKTPKLKSLGDVQYEIEQRIYWPAMSVPLWEEAYGSRAVRIFFDMPAEGHVNHVINGVYDTSVDGSGVLTFNGTLENIEDEERYENNEEEEEIPSGIQDFDDEFLPVLRSSRVVNDSGFTGSGKGKRRRMIDDDDEEEVTTSSNTKRRKN